MKYFTAAGLPKPSFQNQSNGFLVTVFTNVTEQVTEQVTLLVMTLDKEMNRQEIQHKLGLQQN
jgi:hypothetical protein